MATDLVAAGGQLDDAREEVAPSKGVRRALERQRLALVMVGLRLGRGGPEQ